MPTLSFRVNDEEYMLIKRYSEINDINQSVFLRNTILNTIHQELCFPILKKTPINDDCSRNVWETLGYDPDQLNQIMYSNQAINDLKGLDSTTTTLIANWIYKNIGSVMNPTIKGIMSKDDSSIWYYKLGSFLIVTKIEENVITICEIRSV